jgi:E3 ubiquitin-protein ligase HECTD2
LAQLQPEVAKSLQFILDYKDHSKMPLEDIIQRNFTVDVQCFGVVEERELCPGGMNKIVTRKNREEFVKLYIDYEFKQQCAGQLASFKKGFERMMDKEVLKALLSSEELESLVCGQRQLNFAELQDTVVYGNGF